MFSFQSCKIGVSSSDLNIFRIVYLDLPCSDVACVMVVIVY